MTIFELTTDDITAIYQMSKILGAKTGEFKSLKHETFIDDAWQRIADNLEIEVKSIGPVPGMPPSFIRGKKNDNGYEVENPMGIRPGMGTFETFFGQQYPNIAIAVAAKDCAVVNFVVKDNVRYFEIYNMGRPEHKEYQPLMVQHFHPQLGIDQRDDWMVQNMIAKYNFI